LKCQPTYVQIGVTETGTAIYRKTSTLAEEMVADIVHAVERKASSKRPVVPVVDHELVHDLVKRDPAQLPVLRYKCETGIVLIVAKPNGTKVHAVLPKDASEQLIAQAVETLQKVKADRIPTDWGKIDKLNGK